MGFHGNLWKKSQITTKWQKNSEWETTSNANDKMCYSKYDEWTICKHIKRSLDTKCVSAWKMLSIYSTLSRYCCMCSKKRKRNGAIDSQFDWLMQFPIKFTTVSINLHKYTHSHAHTAWIYESFCHSFIRGNLWCTTAWSTTESPESAWTFRCKRKRVHRAFEIQTSRAETGCRLVRSFVHWYWSLLSLLLSLPPFFLLSNDIFISFNFEIVLLDDAQQTLAR